MVMKTKEESMKTTTTFRYTLLGWLGLVGLWAAGCNGGSAIASPTELPQTAVETHMPSPSSTATAELDFYTPFGETGSIWIFPNWDAHYYLLLDLETGQIHRIDGPEEQCTVPRDNGAKVFCEDPEGGLFVFDLLSGERLTMISENSLSSETTNNGQFLYYEHLDTTTGLYTIASYSIAADESKLLYQQTELEYKDRRWYSWAFSEDGERILVLHSVPGVSSIIEIPPGDLNYEIIDKSNETNGGLFVGSQSGNSLVYATEPNIFIGAPDTLYYIDLDKDEIRLLAEAIGNTGYSILPPVYSPDESQIALTTWRGSQICIIQVDTGSQVCRQLLPDSFYSYLVEWSPSGKSIAFVGENRNSPYETNLYIYSIEEDTLVILLEGIEKYSFNRSLIWIP